MKSISRAFLQFQCIISNLVLRISDIVWLICTIGPFLAGNLPFVDLFKASLKLENYDSAIQLGPTKTAKKPFYEAK